MLETLVPSRIRRTLFEYLLAHPDQRFYLRGLAKELGLAVSPVRRELKRLEQLGVLKAYQEANVRFYVVDQTSPLFVQLKSAAGGSAFGGQAALPAALRTAVSGAAQASQQPEPLVASTVLSHQKIERIRRALQPTIHWPTVVGAVSLSVFVVLALVGVLYLAITNQRLLSMTTQAISTPRSHVTVVESEPKASGEMRGTRWRLLPGAVGGFSSGADEETY